MLHERYESEINIGSGNALVPSGSKPLPESLLTKSTVTYHATKGNVFMNCERKHV